jgi:hypothetical protein
MVEKSPCLRTGAFLFKTYLGNKEGKVKIAIPPRAGHFPTLPLLARALGAGWPRKISNAHFRDPISILPRRSERILKNNLLGRLFKDAQMQGAQEPKSEAYMEIR